MDDTQLRDLKDFIDGRVSQAETRLNEDLGKKIDEKIDGLREEMLDGFTGVGEAIETINDRLDRIATAKSPA